MPEPSDEAGPLTRVRLDLSYDGTEFSGWATQPDQRTVQTELETALATVLRLPVVALTVAGRTDAGVHASGQVAHCDLPAAVWDDARDALVRRLNGVLKPDLRVRSAAPVPADFDARFAASWRRYEYLLCDQPGGADPVRRHHVLSWPRNLDVEVMAAAAGSLVGVHDFAAFCKRREGAGTVRHLLSLGVERIEREVRFSVLADAFCHSMVRSLVGALIAVGEGRREVSWPASLLTLRVRANDVPVAPAHGLSLVEVGYPPAPELAARAATTRARRG